MVNPTSSNAAPSQRLHWLTRLVQALWADPHQSTQPATAQSVAQSQPVLLTLQASLPAGQTDVVCLNVEGVLNCHTYTHLIEAARLHYEQGQRGLILDLRQTTRLELSGLFALHSITRLYAGENLLNPERGWAVLHWSAASLTPELGTQVKLLAPSPAVAAILHNVGFDRCLDIYDNLGAALAAFPLE